MKKVVRLNEEKVKNMIKESVIRVLNEMNEIRKPYNIQDYDKSMADDYTEFDRLLARLYPTYRILEKDTFGYGEEPTRNQNTLMACTSLQVLLNSYFGGKYFERIRGGVAVIVTNGNWFDGEYDMADEYYNYALRVVPNAPEEVDEEASRIAYALERGILYDARNNFETEKHTEEKASDEAERAKNGGLKVVGKIQLSPEDLNKKRW